jgi:membrane-associated phospholipid phosphatase
MNSTPTAPVWLRAIFVVLGLAAWFGTQAMIGAREDLPPGVMIGDQVHDWLAGPHRYMRENPYAADALLMVSSAIIDALGIFLLGLSIFGRTVRPFLGLLLVFAMRQICQWLCPLSPPPGMIWDYPSLGIIGMPDRTMPSLLVTYSVATDMFFSGHTAMAVIGAIELARFGGRRWIGLGILIAAFQIFAVLALRAHYTMDVFTGAVVAMLAALLAERWSPWCDEVLAHLRRSDEPPS